MQEKKKVKYLQIEEHFIDLIDSNTLKYEDKIPTEKELCEEFNTSRMTVNKALTRLANKGYIKRISGVGSFVTNRNLRKSIIKMRGSMTEDIVRSGMKPTTKLLEYSVLKGSEKPNIAKRLNIANDEYIHYFARLRYGDGIPVALSYTFISQKLVKSMDVERLEGSINEYFNEIGIKRSHCNEEYTAVIPTSEHIQLLDVKNVALLKRTLLWYVADVPFEYTTHYLLGNRFVMTNSYSQDE